MRPHWLRLYLQLQRSSAAQLRQRQELLARQIQENGVTYNVYADPKGTDRPWELDLLPNLISAEQWQPIAQGVAQRARLLNAVLADVYGEQKLIAEGLLPSELVFGHTSFLWPCQGVQAIGGTYLHSYAVDLARDADGQWHVLADRTQAPSGAGYALENRQIVSRAFPELYRDLRVQYLAGYFRALQETLIRQAPATARRPWWCCSRRDVSTDLLRAPLPRAPAGLPLVEGHDLTVRDATLYLKTLGGLKRVHAVLRRLDDDFCDPSSCAPTRPSACPACSTPCAVAACWWPTPWAAAYWSPRPAGLPARRQPPPVRRRALAAHRRHPLVRHPGVLQETLGALEGLVIKPAFPSQSFEPVFGHNLAPHALEALRKRLQARPHAYVAQRQAQLSQAPVWQAEGERGALHSRAIGMRVFAVATADGGYCDARRPHARGLRGGRRSGVHAARRCQQDTWVLADRPVTGEPCARAPSVCAT